MSVSMQRNHRTQIMSLEERDKIRREEAESQKAKEALNYYECLK